MILVSDILNLIYFKMNKHKILLTISGLAISVLFAAKPEKRPNIIWLMAEDMGQDLECYGMKAVKTPVLNKLAEEGILYTNACCSNPISSPSRSAMMTGMHQTVINAHNHRSNRDLPLPEDVKPITYYLREAGYTCVLGNHNLGKISSLGKGRKIDCNFKHTPIGKWDGVTNFGLFDKYDVFTEADQPFFAQIQLNVTHRGDWWKTVTVQSGHPVDPRSVELPPYMPDHPKIREEWASYLDQIEYMDHEVGLILNELKEKDMIDNTIIFFIADNGRCDIRGKGYLYESGTKIPMIVWGKEIKPKVVNEIVSTLDISASILDLAGAREPDNIMGKLLLKKRKKTEYFYAARDNWDEAVDCIRSVSTKQYTYIRNYMPERPWDQHQIYLDFFRPAIHVMRTLKGEGKLDVNTSLFMADHKPVEELYAIVKDPYELNNLVADPRYTPVLEEMRKMMVDWQAKHKDCGLEDMHVRNPIVERNLRDWVIKNDPQEWEKLLTGEICDKHEFWVKEMNKQMKFTREL